MTSKIEWTDETWNPITGCTAISPGCANCYARRMATRLAGRYGYPAAPNQFDVTLRPDRLEQPLKWRKARRVFVCSMSDLFHEDVSTRFIHRIFETMRKSPQHTFQVLTKRPHRMKDFVAEYRYKRLMETGPPNHDRRAPELSRNIWLGVTAEDQQRADERIPVLFDTPAAVRFVSAEPLLGEIDLTVLTGDFDDDISTNKRTFARLVDGLDQVIVGAETGPGARWMKMAWAKSLRDQCQAAGVPFFFKKNSAGERTLDGVEWEQMPR